MLTSKVSKTSSGFTLIELLVVIAIIAILAAILFPVFASAKQASYRANCATNMKQVYQAITEYAEDRSGKFPPTRYEWTQDSPTWLVMIEPYMKGGMVQSDNTINDPCAFSGAWRITRCPACKQDSQQVYKNDGLSNSRKNFGIYTTMGYNHAALSPHVMNVGFVPQFLTAPTQPSKTVMIVDSTYSDDKPYEYGYFMADLPFDPNGPPEVNCGLIPEEIGQYPVQLTCIPSWGYLREQGGGGLYGGCCSRHGARDDNGLGTTAVLWVDGHISNPTISTLYNQYLWDLR